MKQTAFEEKMFEAVKKDDLRAFIELTEKRRGSLAFCYGRFPLLSVCYLYKSRKIVRSFGEELLEVAKYNIVDEPRECYEKFRDIAGVSLRRYVFSEDCVVTPTEMLAVMGDSVYLEEVFQSARKTQKIVENISGIYKRNHKTVVEYGDNTISIKKPMTLLQRVMLPIIVAVALIMSVFPLSAFAVMRSHFGRGTEDEPIRISNLTQFEAMINENNSDYYYELASDITLPLEWTGKEFSATLDGNGYKIRTSGIYENGIISTLHGTIKNVSFDFGEHFSFEMTKSVAGVVLLNSGRLESVTVRMSASLSEVQDEDIFAACLVYENTGEILTCDIDAQIEFIGTGGGDTSFGFVAAKNSGKVYNAETTEKSEFYGNTVDAGGIVSDNLENGVVEQCTNNAKLDQTTDSAEWMPSMGGVVLMNYGTVRDCFNNGSITINSEASAVNTEMRIGGIVCINYNLIERSRHNASLTAKSIRAHTYVGGISSINYSDESVINSSCAYGVFSITSEGSVDIVGGGLCGYSFGAVRFSYSCAEFVSENSESFFGGIIGIGYYVSYGGYLYSNNEGNYYLLRDNIKNSSALRQTGNQFFIGLTENAEVFESIEEFKSNSIYWG